MALVRRPHPPALPHGPIEEILPGLFFVTGTVALPLPIPVRFSRAMTIIADAGRLTLVNTVRLDEAGLAALDRLGRVTDVIRLAAYHGMDDPFYQERYGAKVWAVAGSRYNPAFDTAAPDVFFEPDVYVSAGDTLPVAGARLHVIPSSPPEGLLLLDQHGGVAISGDALQNWEVVDAYFNLFGRLMMKASGFIRPHNVGPGWLKAAKPSREALLALLDLPFDVVLPSHGRPVLGGAREKFRPSLVKAAG